MVSNVPIVQGPLLPPLHGDEAGTGTGFVIAAESAPLIGCDASKKNPNGYLRSFESRLDERGRAILQADIWIYREPQRLSQER
jgi:hypothetical protein